MKISINLPVEKMEFIDGYTARSGLRSRSAAISEAIGLLQERELADAYSAAFADWNESEDAALWETTSADGLGSADHAEPAISEHQASA